MGNFCFLTPCFRLTALCYLSKFRAVKILRLSCINPSFQNLKTVAGKTKNISQEQGSSQLKTIGQVS